MKRAIAKADVLLEALPYLREFSGKAFVIKYGGSLQDRREDEDSFVRDVVFLRTAGIWPVVVHGGGKEIGRAQKKLGIEPRHVQGLRVTDAATMRVAAAVLGRVNHRIVAHLRNQGAMAVGFSGLRGGVVRARRKRVGGVDIGFVGDPSGVFMAPLRLARREGKIVVLSSVGVGPNGELLNINADAVAGVMAAKLRAAKLVLMTDVPGIRGSRGGIFSSITDKRARGLLRSRVVMKGMIPKVRACLNALDYGVGKAHIIDGRLRHSLLLEIFTTRGIGTEITRR